MSARFLSFARLPLSVIALSVLAACNTAPTAKLPSIDTPAQYKHATEGSWKPAQPAEAQARGEWWRLFNDPVLDQLQQQAQAANPGLQMAVARVQAARASLGSAEASRLPQVGLTAGSSRQRQAPAQQGLPNNAAMPVGTLHQAGFQASYELDLFSRVANSVSAAQADAQASQASYQSVLLALQADVARTHFQLRTLDAEVALLTRTQATRQQTLALTNKRLQAGDVSELDVSRAQTEASTTQAELDGLLAQRARTEHALALLLGKAPASVDIPAQPLLLQSPVPDVPAGLPSSLLERRPDVAVAQAQLMAATARIGQAKSALFPAIVLTANGGHVSGELKDLFDWNARSWLVSAVLNLPLFDGGRNRAGIARAEAALDESVASYRQTVLAAFGDVEDRLVTLAAVKAQTRSLDQAQTAAARAADLADKRYRAGEDSLLTLMDTQRQQLAVERQAIQLRGSWATTTVELVRALGGSWAQ